VQYDRTRIAIRERDLMDVLDLSLKVFRLHAGPLFLAALVGTVPFAIFNWWMLSDLPLIDGSDYWNYSWRMLMLVLFEMPLAAVPTTLLLGQAMFFERFDVARLMRQAVDSLPQLFFYQVLARTLFMPQALFWGSFHRDLIPIMVVLMLLWIGPYAFWPYLNETILLERNPLFTGRGSLSTWKRSKVLHTKYGGDLFARALIIAMLAALLTVGVWLSTWQLRAFIFHGDVDEVDRTMFTVHLPIAMWIVAAFFNVVRFLSYLDLRIRREGWEVELVLRAEAERLARQVQPT
jgi:hypothetical protein